MRASLLDDAAVAHDEDAVGDLAHNGEVVRDEEHGEAVLDAEAFEECDDLGLNGDIERGGGFVGDEKARAIDERHGDHDALPLTAGELVREVVEAALWVGKCNFMKCGDDAGVQLGAGDTRIVGEDGFGDLPADAHDGVERRHGLLKDHGEGAAAVRAHLIFTEGEEVLGVEVGCAGELQAAGDGGCRQKQTQQCQRGCGFAGAGLADQAEGFAGCDVEGDAVNGFVTGEGDAEIARGEQRGR
jgi:hypothetical protein